MGTMKGQLEVRVFTDDFSLPAMADWFNTLPQLYAYSFTYQESGDTCILVHNILNPDEGICTPELATLLEEVINTDPELAPAYVQNEDDATIYITAD